MGLKLNKGSRILFQGDSITDGFRDRNRPCNLGIWYPLNIATLLELKYPEKELRFFNLGIGGDQTKDLVNRWQTDCIAYEPDVVSIMIGINDTWRRYGNPAVITTEEQFEKNYRNILERTKKEAKAQIVILEPFLTHYENMAIMREDLDPKREIVRKLAKEFNTIFVPLDDIFRNACKKQKPGYWAYDGVHPSRAGNGLIAEAWLGYTGL